MISRGMKEIWVPSSLILLQTAFAVLVLFNGCHATPPQNAGEDGTAPREWKCIVIHHSATTAGNAEIFGRYHREQNGWRSLGYDFVIGNGTESGDGEVEIGPRWLAQERGAHAGVAWYNEHGIGICLVGNFNDTMPTEKQMEALLKLCRDLMRRYNIDAYHVLGHGEIKDTECPGALFSMPELRGLLKEGQ